METLWKMKKRKGKRKKIFTMRIRRERRGKMKHQKTLEQVLLRCQKRPLYLFPFSTPASNIDWNRLVSHPDPVDWDPADPADPAEAPVAPFDGGIAFILIFDDSTSNCEPFSFADGIDGGTPRGWQWRGATIDPWDQRANRWRWKKCSSSFFSFFFPAFRIKSPTIFPIFPRGEAAAILEREKENIQ